MDIPFKKRSRVTRVEMSRLVPSERGAPPFGVPKGLGLDLFRKILKMSAFRPKKPGEWHGLQERCFWGKNVHLTEIIRIAAFLYGKILIKFFFNLKLFNNKMWNGSGFWEPVVGAPFQSS